MGIYSTETYVWKTKIKFEGLRQDPPQPPPPHPPTLYWGTACAVEDVFREKFPTTVS